MLNEPSTREGTTLLNRYRLEAELGRGGMGVVYRARDTLLERSVAVKLVHEPRLGTEGRAQLLREARAAAQLNHPNIVSIYDAGEARAPGGPGSTAFIVMELVQGQSLYERAPLPLESVLDIARQICAALEHAHAHGIIHRDLKLENVLLTPEGTVKLTDFGLARAGASRLTGDGGWIGTVFYLAPELAQGQPFDGRADLYSLGVMLYELTTGRLPFEGDDPLLIISQHLHAPPTPPRTHRPDLPEALDAIVLKLLAKNPADRFAGAGEVAHALAHLLSDRAHMPAQLAAVRHNLPLQLTSFIGREKELGEVRRLLAETRLLTVTGPGGTGKTRLVLRAAEDVLHEFPDGVWFVELASLADAGLVPQSIASVLGVREEPGYPLAQALIDHARSKTLLLILDNCEHLIETCAQFAEAFLHHCPAVKVIVTSREALGIAGERSYRLPSLSAPDPLQPLTAEDLMRFEAARLFVERAVAVRPDFRVTEANVQAIAQICYQLDGVPLAIELAAARMRALSVEQIAERVEDRFRLLTGGSRTALPRQQTLRALIDWSYDLLTEAERILFRRLAVFSRGWTLEAAEAVVGGWSAGDDTPAAARRTLEADEVLDLLTHLVDKSLVQVEEQDGAARYEMLETIRQYAREKLLSSGEVEVVRRRHLEFYRGLVERAAPELRRARQIQWLARLETEHDNLRAALKWALSSGDVIASQQLAGGLALFWYFRGSWNEGREWLRKALARRAAEPDSEAAIKARISALLGAAWLADEDGSEIPLYTEAVDLARRVGDRWSLALALRGLASRASYESESERTTQLSQESLETFQAVGDGWGTALALYDQGWQAFNRGDHAQAEARWEESARLFRESGDRWGIGVTLGTLGYLIRLQGNYPRAIKLTQESLTAFRELGDRAGIAVSLVRLGNIAMRRGDYLEATSLLEESLTLRREWGDLSDVVNSKWTLALVAGYQGDYARAQALLEECLALGRNVGEGYLTPYTQMYLGWIHYYRGDIDQALPLWDESLPQFVEQGDTGAQAYTLVGLGLVACRLGERALALQRLEEALALSNASGDKRYLAIALHSLGSAHLAHGEVDQALPRLREGLSYRKKLGDKQGLAESLEGLAGALAQGGAPESRRAGVAARLLGAASALRESIGAPLPPVERREYEQRKAALQTSLGEMAFQSAWAESRSLTLEQAIAYASRETSA